MIQEDPGMLTEVQKDPEHPQRSRMVHKCSKFKCFKSSQKFHHCIELDDSFPTTKISPQTEFVCKSYEWSKFQSNLEKRSKVKVQGKIKG
jgi:hypothetical protein